MNVAPVAPSPIPGRAADSPFPASSSFGDLLGATPAIGGSATALGSTIAPGSDPVPPAAALAPTTAVPANDPAPAQPVAIKAPIADHLPAAPSPHNDEPGTLPDLTLASTDANQPADTKTTAPDPIATPPATSPVAPSPAATASRPAPAPTPAAVADSLVTHVLPWQTPLAADNIAAPKPATNGKSNSDGKGGIGSGKAKSVKADLATTDLPDTQQPQPQPQPTVLAAATTVQQPVAEHASRQGGDSAIGIDPPVGSAGPEPAPHDAITIAPAHGGPDNLPPLLASQTPAAIIAPAPGQTPSYVAATPSQAGPVVAAEPGRIGRDIGVEIARNVAAGRDEVMIRLSPAEMGRIDVRLTFDAKGALHATVNADSPQALDMLRRDASELGRSLADAGIRTDSSSFSFNHRDGGAGQFAQQQGHPGGDGRPRHPGVPFRDTDGSDVSDIPFSPYRQLRASGRIDLMA